MNTSKTAGDGADDLRTRADVWVSGPVTDRRACAYRESGFRPQCDHLQTRGRPSESPVSGIVVEIRADQDTLNADPSDSVMSLGVVSDVGAPDHDVDLSLVHEWFCPYTNAFPAEGECREWAAQPTRSPWQLREVMPIN